MSVGTPKSETPGTMSDNTPGRANTYRQPEVVPLFYGRARIGVKWIVPVLRWGYRPTKTSNFAFFTCVGVISHGPLDEIIQLHVNGKPYNGIFKFRSDYPETEYIDHVLAKETPEYFRIYWGLESQPSVSSYIQSLAASGPLYGAAHPQHRGIALLGIRDMEAGQVVNGATPALPNVEIEVYRRSPTAYSFGYAAHGTHPIGVLKDFLTDKRAGLGLDESRFDSDLWTERMQRLMDDGVGGRVGTDLFISPVLTAQKEVSAVLADCMSYFDGWLRQKNGKIEPDWYPNDGSDPGEVREISIHDMTGDPELVAEGLDQIKTLVAVTGLDWEDPTASLSEIIETAQIPYAMQIVKEPRPEQIQRPFYTNRRQLRAYANYMAAVKASPDLKGTIKVRRESATLPDDITPLLPGDRFQLDYEPLQLDILCRVTERTDSDDKAEVTLKFQKERGASPQPYIPTLDPRADSSSAAPGAFTRYTVTEVPGSEPRAVAILAQRPPDGNVLGYKVHYAATNSWPGTVLLLPNTWAVGAVLQTALTAVTTSTTVNVNSVGDDFTRMISQTTAQQTDDQLLLIAGAEWFSVGAIGVVSAGVYSLAVTRARQGSSATTHAVSDAVFLVYRSDLPTLVHPDFTDSAVRWFKLQPFNVSGDGTLTAAFSYTFPLRNPPLPTGLTATAQAGAIYLKWDVPTTQPDYYEIYEQGTALPAPVINDPVTYIVSGSAVTFYRGNLTSGTTKYFFIRSRTGIRGSAISSEVHATAGSAGGANATPPADPPAPTLISNTASVGDDGTVTTKLVVQVQPIYTGCAWQNLYITEAVTEFPSFVTQLTETTVKNVEIPRLKPGQQCYVYLIAYNEDGVPSNMVSMTGSPVTAAVDTTAPSAPSTITVLGVGPGASVEFDWDDNAADDFSRFQVWRDTSAGFGSQVLLLETSASRYIDNDVTAGVTYYWRVRARDRSGNFSGYTAGVSATPTAIVVGEVDATAPTAPTAATLSSMSTYLSGDGSARAIIVLNVPALPAGARSQTVRWRRNGTSNTWTPIDQKYNTSSETCTIDNLPSNVAIEVSTIAHSFSGIPSTSTAATSSPFTTPLDSSAPAAPGGIAVTPYAGYNEIDISPSAAIDVKQYIYYRNSSNVPGSAIIVGRNDGTKLNDPAPSAGTTQWYWAAAEDESGNIGAKTAGVSVVTASKPVDGTPPPNPAAPVFVASGTKDSADGTVTAWFDFTISGVVLPGKWINLLYRENGTGSYAVGKMHDGGSSATGRIHNLLQNVTYDIAAQQWSGGNGSSIISAGSFTAPTKSTCGAPTGVAMSLAAADLQKIPSSYPNSGANAKSWAGVLKWTAPADKDIAFYECKPVLSAIWRRTVGTETEFPYWSWMSSNPSSDDWSVRAVNTSGARSSPVSTTQGFLSLTDAYGPGSVAEDDRDAVKVSGISTGELSASSVRKVMASFPAQFNVTTTGGALFEYHTVSIANRGFTTAPDLAPLNSTLPGTRAIAPVAGSTSTSLIIFLISDSAANIPASTAMSFVGDVIEWD